MKPKALFFTLLLLAGFGSHQPSAQQAGGRRAASRQSTVVKRVKRRALRVERALAPGRRAVFFNISVPAFLGKNTDGRTGFYLKRVGGQVLASDDETFAFYPASTIKVLEHLHAMRRVQSNSVTLYEDMAIWGDSCADDHSEEIPAAQEDLDDSLRLMMKNSDNQRTNAIQDEFGRAAINQTAHQVVGMSDSSALQHKFGCQGPASDPPNRLTLADAGLLYEGVANGSLLSGTSRDTFYSLMRNETDSFFVGPVINSEAAKLGLTNALRDRFKARVRIATKSGGVPAGYDGFLYESTAGYVSLPFVGVCSESGFGQVKPHGFVYGVFINKATKIADGTVGTAASELFRGQIRDALSSWKACPKILDSPGIN